MISHTQAEKFCQSCGMPMAKDPAGGASLSDGKTSKSVCSLCMSDSEFHFHGTDVKALLYHQQVTRAEVLRTARKIMDGMVF